MLAYIPYMDPMGYMFYYFRVFSKALMLNPSTVSKTILGIQNWFLTLELGMQYYQLAIQPAKMRT